MRSSIPPRRSQSQRPLGAAGRDLERISDTLTRLYARIEGKLQECRIGEQEASDLVSRAERINNRLDVLRVKLRQCYQQEGLEAPANLQVVLKKMAEVDADDAPSELVCPISQCLMIDPVKTCDGQIYDRTSIIEWFATFSDGRLPTSPLTNLPLSNMELTPVLELRQQVQDYIRAKQQAAGHSMPGSRLEDPSRRLIPPPSDGTKDADATLVSRSSGVARGLPPRVPPPGATRATITTPSSAAAAPAVAAHSGRPIWSSSVVPTHEENSRELNLLRVSDIEMPASIAGAAAFGAASRAAGLPGTRLPEGGIVGSNRVSRPMIRSAPLQSSSGPGAAGTVVSTGAVASPTGAATRRALLPARIPGSLAGAAQRATGPASETPPPFAGGSSSGRPASLPPTRSTTNLNVRRR